MKASELRHGNFVKAKGVDHIFQFMWPVHKDLMNEEQFDFYLKSIEPILLTEEWLLKFGADAIETPHDVQYRIKERLFVLRDNIFYDYGSSVKIEHVHQFQNLYFALTGEELKL